jgi:hypothetical protein
VAHDVVGRYYDPQTGQFLSVDPKVQQTLQAYLYVGDNPTNTRDPLGLIPQCQWWNLICQAAAVADSLYQGFSGILSGHDVQSACAGIGWQAQTLCSLGSLAGATVEVVGGSNGEEDPGAFEIKVTIPDESLGPQLTPWGWTGQAGYREAIDTVARGGDIPNIRGKVPTLEEALQLIQRAGGVDVRIDEEGHPAPNPHGEPHINYWTQLRKRGMIIFRP